MDIKFAEIGNRQQKLSNFVNFLFEIYVKNFSALKYANNFEIGNL
jgi:hypothetical protein